MSEPSQESDRSNTVNVDSPRITIIMPCHNHADMVVGAIESVIEQDYRPINIVVVDDGSTDNPEDKIKAVDSLDVNIHLISNATPTGPAAARNLGIKHLWEETDAFMMLDADDRYMPGKITKSVEIWKQDPQNIGIVYTDAKIVHQNKGTIIHEFKEPFSRERLEQECIITNTPLVSKLALAKVGGYDPTMRTAEDWELWIRITTDFVAIHIPETLHVYTVTGRNSTDTVPQEVWQKNWAKIRQKLYDARQKA